MPELTQVDLQKAVKNTFKRVHDKNKNSKVDRTRRPWIRMLEKMKKDSNFEQGVVIYPLQLSFNDPGTTWTGDQELEAVDPDFSLNLEFGYFNYNTAITIKHDLLTRMGFSIVPNGQGTIEKRAMGSDMAFKIQDYIKNLVEGQIDNHDKYLDRLLQRSGAASPSDPVGLFGILTEDPTTGTIGGQSRVTYTQLRHVRQVGLTPTAGGDFRSLWDTALRTANQYSSENGVMGEIDYYKAGSAFISAFKNWAELSTYSLQRQVGSKLSRLDIAIPDDAVYYEGVPVIWDPTMDALDTVDTFSPTCTKLCVGINSQSWKYKTLPGRYKCISTPADAPKQRVSRQDIDSTAHLACDAPASNLILAID